MADLEITRGLVDPLKHLGFPASAGIEVYDGRTLYCIFDHRSRRIMIVAHPSSQVDMAAVAVVSWTKGSSPLAGDLLDELVDPRNVETVRTALRLLENGKL